MTRTHRTLFVVTAASVALVFLLRIGPALFAQGSVPAPSGLPQSAPPAGQGAGPTPGAPGGAGRPGGGGRGNAALTLYNENCSGCHGTTGGAGRAPSLFDEKWLAGTTDDKIAAAIRRGVPNTEMEAFAPAQLSDDQIFQLIAFIRTQTANAKPRPVFVPAADGVVLATEKQTVKVEVVTKGVETPWGLAFLPDGRLLITERPGRLRIFANGKLSDPVKGTPTPHVQQDGGYLDVAVHPQYARNGWIYLSYSEVQPGFVPPAPAAPTAVPSPAVPTGGPPLAADPGAAVAGAAGRAQGGPGGGGQGRGRGPQIPSNTVIVRGKISQNNEWTDQQVIFRVPTDMYVSSGVHFGSRFIWDKQNHLFFSLGERGTMQNAQDLKTPLGKIHRVNDDGTIPKDNPFINTPGAVPSIWSYGHRNPQGLAWDPVVPDRLWESEHGPTGGDEINVIEKGHNYGWGVISMGVQGGITERAHEGMEQPIVYYTPSIGPSGISFYTGAKYPGWKNSSLFLSALVGEQLRRLEIKDKTVTHQEVIFNQFGRIHDVITGPDGLFYIACQNPTSSAGLNMASSTPGMIIRLVPAADSGIAAK